MEYAALALFVYVLWKMVSPTKKSDEKEKKTDLDLKRFEIRLLEDQYRWFGDFRYFIWQCTIEAISASNFATELVSSNARLIQIYQELQEKIEVELYPKMQPDHIRHFSGELIDLEQFKRFLIHGKPACAALYRDEKKSKWSNDIFDREKVRHDIFVQEVVEKLEMQKYAVKEFYKILASVKLEELIDLHFEIFFSINSSDYQTEINEKLDHNGKGTINERSIPLEVKEAFDAVSALAQFSKNFDKRIHARQEAIKAISQRRGVSQLVHFTRIENLEAILDNGIKPVSRLVKDNSAFIRNDNMRLDNHLDAISTSISFPNFKTFFKMRMESKPSEWAVLILKPEILWEKECGFFPLNAADSRMRKKNSAQFTDPSSFEEMFSNTYGDREIFLKDYDPTDSQAEVMVFETVESYYIDAIAFETSSVFNKFDSLHAAIIFSHSHLKIMDQHPATKLFGTREKLYSLF